MCAQLQQELLLQNTYGGQWEAMMAQPELQSGLLKLYMYMWAFTFQCIRGRCPKAACASLRHLNSNQVSIHSQ